MKRLQGKHTKLFRFYLSRLRGKPPKIIAFKLLQGINIVLHCFLRLWSVYEHRARRRWDSRTAEGFLRSFCGSKELMIGEREIDAVRGFFQVFPGELEELRAARDEILAGHIPIFGTEAYFANLKNIQWQTDWRYGHTWPKQPFFLTRNFYEFDKRTPYDVKFPWELSRLNFLMIPSLLATIDEDEAWWSILQGVLQDWQQDNPIGSSINWYPMECSMRSINLAFLVMLAIQSKRPPLSALRTLLQLSELHGRFIYRTIEYTDVRGNHYTANLTAMVLLGILLRKFLREANHWLAYAQRHTDPEILLQYSEDGVHFEKSIPYHRLVTQLFLISLIAREKADLPIAPEAKERLRQACYYTRSYIRPDGLAPMWGDNDDARALWFDTRSLRDHRSLLTLGAAYFDDSYLTPDTPAIDVPLLIGTNARKLAGDEASSEISARYFISGGMVCARFGNDHFIADVGEVGLKGRGGHGHHDTLSFELTLDGVPIIIDPGSYIYTGDPQARNYFRSTAAHNVARIDGEEMATLFPRELWRLGTEATPHDVQFVKSDQAFELVAHHDGYLRLPDPVSTMRRWKYDAANQTLIVQDSFHCAAYHRVERFFHFAPELQLTLDDAKLHILFPKGDHLLATWGTADQADLQKDWVSKEYGHRGSSMVLVLRNEIESHHELFLMIRPYISV